MNQGRSRKGEKINAAICEHDKWFRMEDLKLKLHEYTDKIWKGNARRLKLTQMDDSEWSHVVIIWSSNRGHLLKQDAGDRLTRQDSQESLTGNVESSVTKHALTM